MLKIPGLDALLDPAGPLAKQSASTEALAAAMTAMTVSNTSLARAQYALAESNHRLADALEASTSKAGRR